MIINDPMDNRSGSFTDQFLEFLGKQSLLIARDPLFPKSLSAK
jgi:hypothetical protein